MQGIVDRMLEQGSFSLALENAYDIAGRETVVDLYLDDYILMTCRPHSVYTDNIYKVIK